MTKEQRNILTKLLLIGIIWEYMMDNPGDVQVTSRTTKEYVHFTFNFIN